MTEEQLHFLKKYIEALVAEMIGDAFGRDTLHEGIRRREFEKELDRLVDDDLDEEIPF